MDLTLRSDFSNAIIYNRIQISNNNTASTEVRKEVRRISKAYSQYLS